MRSLKIWAFCAIGLAFSLDGSARNQRERYPGSHTYWPKVSAALADKVAGSSKCIISLQKHPSHDHGHYRISLFDPVQDKTLSVYIKEDDVWHTRTKPKTSSPVDISYIAKPNGEKVIKGFDFLGRKTTGDPDDWRPWPIGSFRVLSKSKADFEFHVSKKGEVTLAQMRVFTAKKYGFIFGRWKLTDSITCK